jgi:DNA modification methylase
MSSLFEPDGAFIASPDFVLHVGDARDILARLPDGSIDCCVTSPPYWGLRDYGVDGQIGLEQTPDEFVEAMVSVFAAVRRVLKQTGTLWLNLGDSYAGGGCGARDPERWPKQSRNDHMPKHVKAGTTLKDKDLVGVPWRVALALQADGWFLRSDIIWSKPNPMPESVQDRPTKAHEYLFLLTKAPRYFYDAKAIQERAVGPDRGHGMTRGVTGPHAEQAGLERRARRTALIPRQTTEGIGSQGIGSSTFGHWPVEGVRNARSVWEIATNPYPEAHFAVFPEELPRRCILAGCPAGGVVLDPFMGSGTTAKVARDLGRKAVGIELNPEYARLCDSRNAQQTIYAAESAA